MAATPDALSANPRLAAIYDALDADRRDLDPYRRIIADLGATSILDVGCGTGTFGCLHRPSGRLSEHPKPNSSGGLAR